MKQDTSHVLDRHPEEAQTSPPEHRMPLPGGDWTLWKWAGLRGPGFPAALVLQLAAPSCAAAADVLLQVESAAEQARIAALNIASNALALQQQPEVDATQRNNLQRIVRSLKKGNIPDSEANSELAAALAELRSTQARVAELRASFAADFPVAIEAITQAIHATARSDRFREAILWQNRQALHNTIEPLLRNSTRSRDAEQRRRELLVATYLQRYCVKNDTIGFFGPVGWAQFQPAGSMVELQPGPGLINARSVDFESWCIEALAQTLAQNPALKPWMAPRRLPFFHLEGTTLYAPGKAPIQLPAAQAALLAACNGTQTAHDIAQALMAHPAAPQEASAIYQALEQLQAMGLIAWTLEIPVEAHAAQRLRQQLERIGDANLRQETLGALNELEYAFQQVVAAAGNAEQLDAAMGTLDTTFTHLTGAQATRAAGQTYAGRTLVYEDCRRDIQARLGPELLTELGPALSLLLDGARWFTYQIANIYRHTFHELHAALVQRTGHNVIDATVFWQQAQPYLMDEQQRPFGKLLNEFQQHWAQIFNLPPDARQVNYTSAELRPQVQAAFAAPRAGWQRTRYHGPDVLIAAPNVEAIQRGEYQFVLGEIHIGANPLLTPYFRNQHRTPEELLGYFAYDLPAAHLVPVPAKDWPVVTTRTPLVIALPKDFLLAAFPDACGLPIDRTVPIGSLVIEQIAGELIVRTRDGRLRFEIIEAFAGLLQFLAFNYFRLLPTASHTPRITIDRLVIQREAWRFLPEAIPWINEKNEAERFLAARRWARSHGIPRWCFAKTPTEIKPFYIDFDSPIYLDLFARMVRRSQESDQADLAISLSEMLPDHNNLWLNDAEDQRYTSELRFVAFDLKE